MGIATFKSRPIAWKQVGSSVICQRFLHVVQHNKSSGTFFVRLDDESRAVLQYKADGRDLCMQFVVVPDKYKGQGLARLLAETAFTYAIVNNYCMYLQCEYLQKYYLTVKNLDLEKHIVGPCNILEGSNSLPLHPDTVYDLPEPKDSQS